MTAICITDIEAAINYWRHKKPLPDGFTLPGETRALAEVYAAMVFNQDIQADESSFSPQALTAWRFNRYAEWAAEKRQRQP